MDSVRHEVVLRALLGIDALTDRYVRRDPGYVGAVDAWLSTTADALGRLRHPAAGFVAARRGELAAAADGHRPDGLATTSTRRAERATAAVVVGAVEQRLGEEAVRLDAQLTEWTERMSQLVAVASQHTELPAPREPREAWLLEVWAALDVGNGTQAMVEYLRARLSRADRLFVLDRVLTNVLGAATG